MSVETALAPSLKLAFVPFGFIMAWAVVGFLPLTRSSRPSSILVSTILGTSLMLMLFYVGTRFRMTLAPAAFIMAGGGVDHFLGNSGNVKRASLLMLLVTVLCIVSLPPFVPLSKDQLLKREARYWANLGVAFETKGRLEKALWAYDQAIGMDPERVENFVKKTQLLEVLNGDKRKIIPWARYVAERFPREHSAWISLGDLYQVAGQNDRALENYRKAIDLNQKTMEAPLKMGTLLGKEGRHQEARAVLAEGLKANPEDTRLQVELAVACSLSGEREEARRWLREVLAKDPGHAQTRRLLENLGGEL